MKQELMDKLIDILESEYKIYQEILKLSEQKTNIITEGKVTELENIVKMEQALVLQVSKIDKQREEQLKSIFANVDIPNKEINISELKKYASKEQKKNLEEYKSNILNIMEKLNHVNKLNSKLIKNSLEFIEFSLNLASNADITSNNYGQKGDTTNTEKKNFFDIKL